MNLLSDQFERLEESWNRLREPSFLDHQIGSFTLRVYSPASLNKLTRALSHLRKPASLHPPDLTICLWDASLKEAQLPPFDWTLLPVPYSGYQEGPLLFQWFASIEALSLLHLEKKRAYYVVRNSEHLPWWVEGSPLQAILNGWLQQKGLQLTHTAALGDEKGALLLTGKGGSGKSTTTLSCLQHGLNYIGEDYSILELGQEPRALSIYHSAKWTPHTRVLFPQYETRVINPAQADKEKALVFYGEIFPHQIKTSLPLRGTVSLTIGQEKHPTLCSIDPSQAIQHLMMSTLKQLPFCGAQTIQFFKKIGQSLPHYHLTLGSHLPANVQIIQELLQCKY